MNNELLKLDKQFNTLMEDTMKELGNTEINHVSPGSVARLLLAKVNQQIAGFYQKLEADVMKPILSKSSGASLDLVGVLLNCSRYPNETDDNYKYRISKQTLSLERANETSIRLAVLSVPEVKEVIMREFTQGTGSFSVYPIVDNPKAMQIDTLNAVKDAVELAKTFGTRANVLVPRLAPVELRARLLFDERAPEVDRTFTRTKATDYVRTYIAGMLPGDTIHLEDIKKEIKKMDENLLNVEVYHFRINNRPMVVTDQTSAWNEQYIEADTSRAILVS